MDATVADKLSADSLAYLLIITRLCHNLSGLSPELGACVRKSFDEATSKAEDVAIHLGERARPEYTIEAIRVIEQIRGGVLSSKRKPRSV